MNLREIKKHAAQVQQTIVSSFGNVSKSMLVRLDDFRKSSVTQENSIANKVLTEYKQLTSLALAGTLVFTSGIFAYQKVEFNVTNSEMALDTPKVIDKGTTAESVLPTAATKVAAVEKTSKSNTLIDDRTLTKGAEPFILKTALARISEYGKLGLNGYSLQVNGEEVGFFANSTEVEKTLAAYKNQYLKGASVEASYFKENVTTTSERKMAAKFKGFGTTESVLNYIAKGTDVETVHTVADGESLWTISLKYEISVDDLIAANPKVTPERIKAGDKISLLVARPLLTLCTIETVKYTEEIPFTVKYTDNSKMYKGEVKVTSEGSSGARDVVAKVVKENGVVINKQVLSEKVLVAAKEQVVSKGTLKKPATAATGKLAKPFSRGTFSSGFGRRWGRMHDGVDWSMPIGSPILAADGGTVVSAGYDGAYGYCIIINHGNGLKTRYAHNSKLLVSAGDKVYKGQKIANSGNSGRTTGPHLHFEVIKNGSVVNPLKYVN